MAAYLNQQVQVNHIVDDVNFEIQIQRQPGELYKDIEREGERGYCEGETSRETSREGAEETEEEERL